VQLTIKQKIMILFSLFALVVISAVSFLAVANIYQRGEKLVTAYRNTILNERKEQVRNYVEMAISTISNQSQDEAKKIIKNMKYGKNGYLWISDYNCFMVAHPDPRLDGRDSRDLKDPNGIYILREIVTLCQEKGEGFVSYKWRLPGEDTPQPKLNYAKTIPKWNWIVSTGIYLNDIDTLVAQEQEKISSEATAMIVKFVVLALLLTCILLFLATVLVNRFIDRPLDRISTTLKNFNNDLTIRIPVTTHDEIGDLTSWVNDHIGNLQQLIGMVAGVTQRINSHAGTITETVDHQAGFATQLSSSVVEISATMEEFSSAATQIAQHSQGVVEIAAKTLQDTKDGVLGVETLTAKMSEISNDNEANLREIVELGRKSKEINKIKGIINNIANQTKLIAFNAALEAASAGEAGKRFGVVAVEIRRLADSVVASTGEIEGKVTEIMDAVNRLVLSSEKGAKGIREGLNYSEQTEQMLNEVLGGAEATADAAKQISLSTQQQQTASSQVVIALRDIEEGTRHSSTSIQQISSIANDLAQLADSLKLLVARFHVGENHPTSQARIEMAEKGSGQ